MSLNRQFRLHSKGFTSAFQCGHRYHSKYFSLFYQSFPFKSLENLDNKGERTPLLGISIRKKDYKRAIERNRIKRIVRESYFAQIEALEKYQIVIRVKPGLNSRDKKALRLCIDTFLNAFLNSLS